MKSARGHKVPAGTLPANPLWYKDAVIYEVHVRAFRDANADGAGDFRGLTEKLDYLQDLGVTAIWLLPFYPSPWKDDGYDIADYLDVHTTYGALRDFQVFLREAHRRGLRVITELVINHTSDEHPWFQRARRAPVGSPERDFYVWSDSPDRYTEARIIFRDFEASNWRWDPAAKAYYWHRFYSHQPDLNFDNPAVHRAIFKTADFWLKMGVDGLRLDAIPYLYEREGTSCENLPETQTFLKALRRHIDRKFNDRMLLAEANQWPEDAVQYFGDGDECHMAFHFPLMPRLFMSIAMEDRYPIEEIMEQTPAIHSTCQWAIFLRNHDELTLEMVTDAERDYMYRAYARDAKARVNLGIRRRLAPLLGNNRRRIELMNALLFAMPGTPIIYYGDEIGMGDNIFLGDRNGVRTPMQWNADRNAGFSSANPQRLYLPIITDPEYHYEAINVETQQANPTSLLWWMKRLIALRKRYRVFGHGTIEFLHPENRKVIAFLRRTADECVLVVANVSRFCQGVELDLSAFRRCVPVELFGMTPFRPIGDEPYFFTLGPHSFFWFVIQPASAEQSVGVTPAEPAVPTLTVVEDWAELLDADNGIALAPALLTYLGRARWFGGKARVVRGVRIVDRIGLRHERAEMHVLILRVDYREGESERYALPVGFATGEPARQIETSTPEALVCRVTGGGEEDGILYEVTRDAAFGATLLQGISRGRTWNGDGGQIVATRARELRPRLAADGELTCTVMKAEQSNTSLLYSTPTGGSMLLKCLRRLEAGVNPDLEIQRYLTADRKFNHSPAVLGALEYRRPDDEPVTLGMLSAYVPNQGDGWTLTVDAVRAYLDRAMARVPLWESCRAPTTDLAWLMADHVPSVAYELIGPYVDQVRLLGQRTGELHLALGRPTDDAAFKPETFVDFQRRSLCQTIATEVTQALQLLRRQLPRLSAESGRHVEALFSHEGEIRRALRGLQHCRSAGQRIRVHGDYHLGQVLFTGKDFYILDFEGEPARSLGERRTKNSPLCDVAGLLRSFHYARETGIRAGHAALVRAEDHALIHHAAECWQAWVSSIFLRAYLGVMTGSGLLPRGGEELQAVLHPYLLQKAAYELRYELNNRPDWVGIPIDGMLQVLGREETALVSVGEDPQA